MVNTLRILAHQIIQVPHLYITTMKLMGTRLGSMAKGIEPVIAKEASLST